MRKSGNSQAIMDKLSLVADYLLVGVLWLLCSVPLVTTGAATSAMYRTVYQCMFQKEGYVLGTFFKAFKQSFFQSSLIWTGYLVLASSFLLNRQQLAGSYSLLSDAIQIVLGICLLVLLPLVVLVLAYIARFGANPSWKNDPNARLVYRSDRRDLAITSFCSGVITCCSEKNSTHL